MTTVDLESGAAKAAPSRITLRLGALLLAHWGELPQARAVEFAETVRSGGRSATRMVADGMRPLVHDGVAVRRGDTWYAPSLADLGAWIADGFEYREDADMAENPVLPPAIPQQQAGARHAVAA